MCTNFSPSSFFSMFFLSICVVVGKKPFDENIESGIIKSLQESFRIDYFLYIVDKEITTL